MKNKLLNRKQLIWLSLAWFVGICLIILAMTDAFREPFFQGSNTIPIFLIAVSGFSLMDRILKYKKSKSAQD